MWTVLPSPNKLAVSVSVRIAIGLRQYAAEYVTAPHSCQVVTLTFDGQFALALRARAFGSLNILGTYKHL